MRRGGGLNMPQYYNPGLYGTGYVPQSYYSPAVPGYSSAPPQNYMISVDGEQAARAWQMPNGLPPGSVIPLYDVDGVHVYFKSLNAYGQLNPLRKGRVIMEDEPVLPAGQSAEAAPSGGNTQFVTKEDLNELRKEIRSMLTPRNNQNGSNRGEGK